MKKVILIVLLIAGHNAFTQNLYDLNTIQKIELNFTQSNWDYQMDTAATGKESYIIAKWIKINGIQLDSVGVRYKGNSSFNPNQVKNPMHIELDYVKNQDYQGYTDIKLSNCFKDPSFVREVLSYKILRNYMHAPLSNYAQVYINGNENGLYVSDESINKSFLDDHFYSNSNAFFKCNPVIMGPNSKPNLLYLGTDSLLYNKAYELKSDYGWADLVKLCDILGNNVSLIENYLDVDRALWMLAFDNLFVNLDSYIGAITQNYYIYKDDNGRFNPVIWDLNESFGCFQSTGTGGPLNVSQMQTLTSTLHINDAQWPLIKNLLSKPMFKRMYIAHMKTIMEENFTNSDYITQAQLLQSVIDTAVSSDANKLYTYSDFQNNVTSNVIVSGNFTVPGIQYLMDARKTYLAGTTEFLYPQPVISNILPSNSSPAVNSNIFITATVSNANAVFLGVRHGITERFYRYQMLDDGLNGDGAAGDGVYGVSITVNSPLTQYYIYAENSNAGIFSPQRAEHEFYQLYSDSPVINKGDVVINEIMAINNTTVADPGGSYSDWVELYNNTNASINLDNLYLSDSYANKLKWHFSNNSVIPPYGYLIVWADKDTAETGIHANYNLSGSGEELVLCYSNGTIIDSIGFPVQSADITYGRYPNGTGNFTFLKPTFSALNSLLGVDEFDEGKFRLFPNPANNVVNIFSVEPIRNIDVYSFTGQLLKSYSSKGVNLFTIEIGDLPKGVYAVVINKEVMKKLVNQ